jgi:hypothetical protein
VTGGVQFFRNMGSTIGAAIMGSVMLSRMKVHYTAASQSISGMTHGHVSPQLEALMRNPMALKDPQSVEKMKQMMASTPGMFENVMALIKNVLTGALHDVFFLSIMSAVLAFIFAVLLREIPLRDDRQKEIAVID